MDKFIDYLTVGQLREKIKDMPDDAKVYYRRIEDVYFDKYEWSKSSVFKPCFPYADDREMDNEYTRAFQALKYKDDPNLYIDAHY